MKIEKKTWHNIIIFCSPLHALLLYAEYTDEGDDEGIDNVCVYTSEVYTYIT